MGLVFRVYQTNSPTNKIDKDIKLISGYTIDLKNRPKDFNNFDIDFSGNRPQVLNFNYAYLGGGYNFYYFVKIVPSNIGNQHYKLHLELDPLMTYKSQILSLKCITDRNTNNYNVYLKDNDQKITSQYKQFYHTFSGGNISFFKPHESILISLVGSD